MCIGHFAAPIKVDVVAMAYNKELVGADELPKKWEDILDPKWRGKMVMADAAASTGALQWYAAMRKTFGKEFMEALSKQDVLIRTGSGEVVNTMISGERPISCMVYQYHVETAISKGAPLKVLIPEEGAPVGVTQIAIAANGPNVEEAKKFIDFVMGYDAQLMWKQKYFTGSARDDLPETVSDTGAVSIKDLKQIASSPEDAQEYFDNNAELSDEWIELFKT
jgi:iron(III) transport system substrate-binding protein